MNTRNILLSAGIVIVGCQPMKQETSKEDSVVVTNHVVADSAASDFNDQDYGDPGLSGFLVPPDSVDEPIRDFLQKLSPGAARDIIEDPFLILTPGPGLYPVTKSGRTQSDLFQLRELQELTKQPSWMKWNCYRTLPDKCVVMDSFPDGIYFDLTTVTPMEIVSEDGTLSADLQAFNKRYKDQQAVEFAFKFTNANDETIMVDLVTVLKNGRLVLVMVDQRDCGA